MYKGFFEDLAYIFDLIGKEIKECSEEREERSKNRNDDEEGSACDQSPCFRDIDDDDEDDDDDEKCAMGCGQPVCCREEDDDDESEGGLLGRGPVTDIMKCLFDASDVDYDYED